MSGRKLAKARISTNHSTLAYKYQYNFSWSYSLEVIVVGKVEAGYFGGANGVCGGKVLSESIANLKWYIWFSQSLAVRLGILFFGRQTTLRSLIFGEIWHAGPYSQAASDFHKIKFRIEILGWPIIDILPKRALFAVFWTPNYRTLPNFLRNLAYRTGFASRIWIS